jgi:hypothetical protein
MNHFRSIRNIIGKILAYYLMDVKINYVTSFQIMKWYAPCISCIIKLVSASKSMVVWTEMINEFIVQSAKNRAHSV